MRSTEASGASASRLDFRATCQSLDRSDRRGDQEVVSRQLSEASGDQLQKKSLSATERDEGKRRAYWNEVVPKDSKRLVFIDETSAYAGQSREYGWAAGDERVYDTRPKDTEERASLIAAASLDGAMTEQALVIGDTVNKHAFPAFLEFTLLPTLAKGSIIVTDNWTVHPGDEVGELVQARGCELLCLPTYSPDPNPIEHLFAKIKAFVKGLRPNHLDDLVQAFCHAVKTVTSENVLNAFRHCGYHVEK